MFWPGQRGLRPLLTRACNPTAQGRAWRRVSLVVVAAGPLCVPLSLLPAMRRLHLRSVRLGPSPHDCDSAAGGSCLSVRLRSRKQRDLCPAGLRQRILLYSVIRPCCALPACHSVTWCCRCRPPSNPSKLPAPLSSPRAGRPECRPAVADPKTFGFGKNDTVVLCQSEEKGRTTSGAECHGSAVNDWPAFGPAPITSPPFLL